MNLLIKIIVLGLSSVLFSCSTTTALTTDTFAINSNKGASNYIAHTYQVVHAKKTQTASLYAINTKRVDNSKQVNVKKAQSDIYTPKAQTVQASFTHRVQKRSVANSMVDRELMLSFYRSAQTADQQLMLDIVNEDNDYLINNHTGYESMYVRNTSLRGSTTIDPATKAYKLASQKSNAGFGMTIARR